VKFELFIDQTEAIIIVVVPSWIAPLLSCWHQSDRFEILEAWS